MTENSPAIIAGQVWKYRNPLGLEQSRLVVGAVVTFRENEKIICVAAHNVAAQNSHDASLDRLRLNTELDTKTIPFIPMSEEAFRATITIEDGTALPPPAFQDALQKWQSDPKGLQVFTVPFEGSLDRMIAMQMANIVVGKPAA